MAQKLAGSDKYVQIRMGRCTNNTLAESGRGLGRRGNSESHSCKETIMLLAKKTMVCQLVGQLWSFVFKISHCHQMKLGWCHILKETQLKVSSGLPTHLMCYLEGG